MTEIRTFNGYFTGNVFRASLVKCRPSIADDLAVINSKKANYKMAGSFYDQWDCKLWTVDESGKVKSLNMRC